MKKLFYFFAILMALYSLPSLAQGDPSPAVNMDKYITLTVQSGKDIRLNFKAAQANTPVRIVSGTNTQDITVGTDWYVQNKLENDNFSVKSDGTTMTIYGDITGFNCSENGENLTSLDVSKNTQLTYLNFHDNELTSLDVSNNTQLKSLYCDDNQHTSLDVSKNPQLTELGCGRNNLTSLDVSKNTQLTTLYCSSNQLTSLDLSKNTMLTELYCRNNWLTSLDLSKNTMLTELHCNINGLTSLDVSKNTQLAYLNCHDNGLTSLDVSKNTQLTELYCAGNQLTSLDVSKNTQLTTLYCSSNQLTSLDISKNTQLTSLRCYRNKFTTESMNELYCSLPDRQGREKGIIYPLYKKDDANHAEIVAATSDNARAKNWEVKYDYWNIRELDVPSNGNYDCSNPNPTPNMSKYITLTVQSGKDIRLNFRAPQANTPVRIVSGTNTQDITVGTDWFVDFSILNDNYTVTSNDTTMTIYGELDAIDCSSNQLTSLDVSKNTQLAYLDCDWNQLTSLDISKNTQLTTLDCGHNQLTSLDVSKNTQLTTLYCGRNPLTSLDVSKNPQLTTLYCRKNQLTSLDVSKNTQLTWLSCYNNPFTTEALNILYCSLPDRQGEEKGEIFPLYKQDDANHAEIVAATSDNARKKNWLVNYYFSEEKIPSNGNYDCNSGVDEHLASSISVFPNPATSKVQIQLKESVNETLILVDLAGRAVLLEDVVAGRANIDVSNLTAGTYFIRIGNITKKLTVK